MEYYNLDVVKEIVGKGKEIGKNGDGFPVWEYPGGYRLVTFRSVTRRLVTQLLDTDGNAIGHGEGVRTLSELRPAPIIRGK